MNNCKFKHFIVKIQKEKERFWVFPFERINMYEYYAYVLNDIKNQNINIKDKIKIDLRHVLDTKMWD